VPLGPQVRRGLPSPAPRWRRGRCPERHVGVDNLDRSLASMHGLGRRRHEAEAIRVLLEKYEIVRAMFRPDTKGGFDYPPALHPAATSQARLVPQLPLNGVPRRVILARRCRMPGA
jgi:hypothetical protein